MKNNILIKSLLLVMTVVILGIGTTYAYFQIAVSGNETGTTINVGGATFKLTYAAGSQTITGTNIIPGWNSKKLFNVTATNGANKALTYNINLVVSNSNFFISAADTNNTSTKAGTSYLTYALNSCSNASDTACSTTLVADKTLDIQSGTKNVSTINNHTSGTKYYALIMAFPNNTTLAQSQTGTDGAALKFTGRVTISSSTTINA